jgi:hypothetical protein
VRFNNPTWSRDVAYSGNSQNKFNFIHVSLDAAVEFTQLSKMPEFSRRQLHLFFSDFPNVHQTTENMSWQHLKKEKLT